MSYSFLSAPHPPCPAQHHPGTSSRLRDHSWMELNGVQASSLLKLGLALNLAGLWVTAMLSWGSLRDVTLPFEGGWPSWVPTVSPRAATSTLALFKTSHFPTAENLGESGWDLVRSVAGTAKPPTSCYWSHKTAAPWRHLCTKTIESLSPSPSHPPFLSVTQIGRCPGVNPQLLRPSLIPVGPPGRTVNRKDLSLT